MTYCWLSIQGGGPVKVVSDNARAKSAYCELAYWGCQQHVTCPLRAWQGTAGCETSRGQCKSLENLAGQPMERAGQG